MEKIDERNNIARATSEQQNDPCYPPSPGQWPPNMAHVHLECSYDVRCLQSGSGLKVNSKGMLETQSHDHDYKYSEDYVFGKEENVKAE